MIALERALPEQVVHERADVEPDLRPQRLVVGLEDHPLEPLTEALLDEQRGPADRDVLPLARLLVGAVERPRAPDDVAVDRERAQDVDAERVELPVLEVGELERAASRRASRPSSAPAGAFQTPRWASVRAYTPASVPLGPTSRGRPSFSGSGIWIRGKYSAALRLPARVAVRLEPLGELVERVGVLVRVDDQERPLVPAELDRRCRGRGSSRPPRAARPRAGRGG